MRLCGCFLLSGVTSCPERSLQFGGVHYLAGCSPVIPCQLAKEFYSNSPTIFFQNRVDANRTAAGVGDIYRHAGISERSQPPGMSVVSLLQI